MMLRFTKMRKVLAVAAFIGLSGCTETRVPETAEEEVVAAEVVVAPEADAVEPTDVNYQ